MNILTGIMIAFCAVYTIWHIIKLLFLDSSDTSSFYRGMNDADYRLMNFLTAIFYAVLIFVLVHSLN